MSLLHDPHHDGSPLYVSDEAPELGATVTVRRPHDAADPVEAVWLRTTYDAEPVLPPGDVDHRDGDVVWWEGALPVHNPVTHYRFLLVRGRRRGRRAGWLTGAGRGRPRPAGRRRLPAQLPTRPHPTGAATAVVYQVFPDRFARSAAADERETPDWAVPAEWDDEVVFEGSDPRTPHAALRRRPRRHHRAPRPPRRARRRRALHDAGLPRREQPPLQRDSPSTRSTRCSAATRRTPGSAPPCTSGAGGSSAT